MRITPEVEKILGERFGHDNVLPLATLDGAIPAVRMVNAYYEDGAFYIITYAKSGKMRQIAAKPACAICGEWFSAQGTGVSLGWVKLPENREIFEKLGKVFAEWFNNGHNNYDDPDCVILKVRLTSCVLLSHGARYEVSFT